MSAAYEGRWIVITGPRDLITTPGSGGGDVVVRREVAAMVAAPALGVVFGGARGVDTVALEAAGRARGRTKRPYLLVVVPGRVDEQPYPSAVTIREWADEIIELRLPLARPVSFSTRNSRMLVEAARRSPDGVEPLLAAFPPEHGLQQGGGTYDTIRRAAGLGVEVVRFPVAVYPSAVD